jgi:hypothetical protein
VVDCAQVATRRRRVDDHAFNREECRAAHSAPCR